VITLDKSDKSEKKSEGKTTAKRTAKSIIRLENIYKIYQMGEVEVNALKDVSLEINKGDFVAITGSSGSGKSTMMNLVGCLDLPTKGSIYLDNRNISDMGESELAQVRGKTIGFIFQQFHLIPSLNALENVMLPLEFQDMPTDEAREKASHFLNIVGLSDRIHHHPSQLSGGQQQRVAIARALANNPEVILADEPTGNLDSKSGQEVLALLKDLWKNEGKTIIMVTHDMELATHARIQIHLKDGMIV
jgi:putative ABC transport system ATP-binding protein